jgi:hypothetical protein
MPNVASVSGLFIFVLCLEYPMLPVSLDFFNIGHSRHRKKINNPDTGNIGHSRHRTKINNPETLATLGIQGTGKR